MVVVLHAERESVRERDLQRQRVKESSKNGSYRQWGRGGGDPDGDAAVRARDAADLLYFGRRGLGTVRSWARRNFTVRTEGFTVPTEGFTTVTGGWDSERERRRE